MSDFVLLGTRPAVSPELSPAGFARELAALAAWHGSMRRWGLLRSYAVRPPWVAGHWVLLIVRAAGPAAAGRLAAGWRQAGGYDVTVVQLREDNVPAGVVR
jgi:hypothetical protein